MEMPNALDLEQLYKKYNNREKVSMSVGTGDDKFTFTVKYRLDMDEVKNVVKEICNGVFDTDTAEYHPELKDFYLRVAVINAYTDIALPQDDSCWRLVYGTPVFAMVTGHYKRPVVFDGRDYDNDMAIDIEQYEQIISSVDRAITYMLDRSTQHSVVVKEKLDEVM